MANVSKKLEQIQKLEKQIEDEKNKIHTQLGEILIEELEIDYNLLSTKKEINDVVSTIKNQLKENPFVKNHSSLETSNNKNSNEEISDNYDREENREQIN